MIEIKNISVGDFKTAIRGMRNSYVSWDKSDSTDDYIGDEDLKLMLSLIRSGRGSERKFLRFINVSMDINAPLYWWKQFDTYKVGTVCNSTSTMHTITKDLFRMDDFSYDDLSEEGRYALEASVIALNGIRNRYLSTGDKTYWNDIIKLLPESYNQLRTVSLNYEVLYNIYFDRRNHRLNEWETFCKEMKVKLPYFQRFVNEVEENF